MTKRRFHVEADEFKRLEEMGYYTIQFSPIHYRIMQGDDFEVVMDVWPTTHEYCITENGYMSKSKVYDNLIETVELQLDIFNRLNR